MKKGYKHLTMQDRRTLEALYADGCKAGEIAKELGVHIATVYNELKRGDTGEMDSNGRIGYSAEKAQRRAYELLRGKRDAAAVQRG